MHNNFLVNNKPFVDKSGHPPAEAIASAIAGRSPLDEGEKYIIGGIISLV
jgi:hypothetical protein